MPQLNFYRSSARQPLLFREAELFLGLFSCTASASLVSARGAAS
jgi:hypothetical protein